MNWINKIIKRWKRGVCNNCKHLTFGVVTNEPLCMRNDQLFIRHKRADKFSCNRWEEGTPREAWQ